MDLTRISFRQAISPDPQGGNHFNFGIDTDSNQKSRTDAIKALEDVISQMKE